MKNTEQGMKDLKSALKAGLISVNEYSTLVYQLHQKNKHSKRQQRRRDGAGSGAGLLSGLLWSSTPIHTPVLFCAV